MSTSIPFESLYTAPATSDRALDYIRAFGSGSLAYSALQPGLRVFEDDGGALVYRNYFGHHLVLGDPLCAESSLESLLDEFTATHPRAVFAQINTATAQALASRNYNATPVGCDTEIDIPAFTLDGHAKRDLRRASNNAMTAGLTVTEARDSEALRYELRQLSNRWMQTRQIKHRELSFLIRPLVDTPEPGVHIFVANQNARLAGFVIFDPRYRAGCNTGYTASILRAEPDAPAATIDFILLQAIQQFQHEGVRTLSLGVMPFHNLNDSVLPEAKTAQPLHTLLRIIARTDCAPFLNIHGLNFHKSRYRPVTTPVYLAAKSSTGLLPMTLLTRACGLLP